MNLKYIGRSDKDLDNEKEYTVSFEKIKKYGTYRAHIIFNVTDNKEMNCWLMYSSRLTIKQNWSIDDFDLEVEIKKND